MGDGGTLRRSTNARGVYVFVMTPMKTALNRKGAYRIDTGGLEKNARYFAGVKGRKTLVICGGSGEFYALSPSEVKDLAAAAVAGVRGSCRIVCGIGWSTGKAVKMAESAQDAGCDALLVMPHDPVVARGEAAIWRHHLSIAKAVDIGIIPFRAPRQLLSIDLVRRFSRLAGVVAIKEESNAVDWVRTGCRAIGHCVPIITGGGENMAPYYYLAGASGFTTGMANLTLPMSIEMHNAGMRRHWKSAMELRDWFEPLTALRGELGTPMLKAGLEMMGLAGGPMRGEAQPQPAVTPTSRILAAKDRARVRRLLKKKGVF
ncbi:MAG: dihydrodipicolinate synthase family protein [Gemmatimonadetes bacterium]|nr:dihydrodipicolinate synthase family protein [Gemmatimonadota bacterium]